MTKIDYKAKYHQTAGLLKLCRDGNHLLTMEKDEAMRKYMDAERELEGVRKNMSELRCECPDYESPFDVAGLVACLLCIGVTVILSVWGVSEWLYLKQPIVQPYVVYRTHEDTASLGACLDVAADYRNRVRGAWKVLEHHHSGPNNSRAFAILDGSKKESEPE
jgi:hypothetical protein